MRKKMQSVMGCTHCTSTTRDYNIFFEKKNNYDNEGSTNTTITSKFIMKSNHFSQSLLHMSLGFLSPRLKNNVVLSVCGVCSIG